MPTWVECSIDIDGRNDRISVNRANRTSRHRFRVLSRDKRGFPRFRWGKSYVVGGVKML